jgi:hypothetical protein
MRVEVQFVCVRFECARLLRRESLPCGESPLMIVPTAIQLPLRSFYRHPSDRRSKLCLYEREDENRDPPTLAVRVEFQLDGDAFLRGSLSVPPLLYGAHGGLAEDRVAAQQFGGFDFSARIDSHFDADDAADV